jgi:hypothetical protein
MGAFRQVLSKKMSEKSIGFSRPGSRGLMPPVPASRAVSRVLMIRR